VKTLRLPAASALGVPASGYDIFRGEITREDGEDVLAGARAGNVLGRIGHGSLEGDALRGALLAELLGRGPSRVSFRAARDARLDRLGDLVERHLDVEALLAVALDGAPAGLPFLPPGGGA
jgi:adenosylcobyric acid synthase